MSPRKAQKFCTFTVPALQALLRQLKLKQEQSLKSAEYMLATKKRLVAQYQEQLDKEQAKRREAELVRMYNLLDMKLIDYRDISEETCMLIDEKVVTFSSTKKKDRRCEDPPPKETVLDPVYRYHTSVIADPFEILGVEKPPVNVTCDLTDGDDVTATTYTKSFKEPMLQTMSESESVNELYEMAEQLVMRTAEGCKEFLHLSDH